jgi:hypothetical protein
MVGFGIISVIPCILTIVLLEATMNEIKMLEIKSFNFKIKNKV